jgi:hypothetical protein
MVGAWSVSALSILRRVIRGIDVISRRAHGIRVFDASPDCLLRIGIGRVGHGIRLSDGIVLRPGDAFVELHLWNEHLAIPAQGADLRWAARGRRQFERSLRKLIEHMEGHAEFAEIRALMMKPALADPQLEQKVGRIFAMFGFERTSEAARAEGFLQRGVDNLWLWVLTWTFNPHSLKGRRFARKRQELWISRSRLTALYGADERRSQAWHRARRATARGIS